MAPCLAFVLSPEGVAALQHITTEQLQQAPGAAGAAPGIGGSARPAKGEQAAAPAPAHAQQVLPHAAQVHECALACGAALEAAGDLQQPRVPLALQAIATSS